MLQVVRQNPLSKGLRKRSELYIELCAVYMQVGGHNACCVAGANCMDSPTLTGLASVCIHMSFCETFFPIPSCLSFATREPVVRAAGASQMPGTKPSAFTASVKGFSPFLRTTSTCEAELEIVRYYKYMYVRYCKNIFAEAK